MSRSTRFPTANGLGTPDIRQRASTSASAQHVSPTYRERENSGKMSGRPDGEDRKGKGKAKAKWEVGTKGWVKEGFRKFGEHCARNQVCLNA